MNKSIVAIDLSQNALSPKSAAPIALILSHNNSIIDLNLGSTQGANRNRMGKDGTLALSYGFGLNQCLVQFLNLRAVTLGNMEVEMLADSFQDYLYLLHLDLSQNRIEGTRGGAAIARILGRKPHLSGGQNIQLLNL